MTKEVVATASAPGAVGPYSQGVRAGGLLFASGQVALDPATGAIVPGGVEEQTHRVMSNLKAVLEAGGSALDHVVKATVYLVDFGDFEAMNQVYATYFPGVKPARVCVEVSKLPKNGRVEIDAIGMIPGN
jgi:2-iminobutanoate/2-iminopropanoate deaminase